MRVPSWARHCSPHLGSATARHTSLLGRGGSASGLLFTPRRSHSASQLALRGRRAPARPRHSRRFRTFDEQAKASTGLAEAMKCNITVNEGGELHRAAIKAGAGGEAPQHVTVTLESPSRHLQKAIEILQVAIAAAKKAGVDAAEQEAAQLWLEQLQEAEAKVR